MKKILALVLAAAMVLALVPMTAMAAEVTVNSEADFMTEIGKLDAENLGDVTIKLAPGLKITKNVTISQRTGTNVTIVGDGSTTIVEKASFTIDGNSNLYGTETVKIQGIVFDTTGTTLSYMIGCVYDSGGADTKRYAHNVTIDSCKFIDTAKNMATAACRFQQCRNITIVNCTAEGMHSLYQANSSGSAGLVIQNTTINECAEGVNAGASSPITVEGCSFDVTNGGYGVRMDTNTTHETEVTIKNNTFKNGDPVVIRQANNNVNLQITQNSFLNLTMSEADKGVIKFANGATANNVSFVNSNLVNDNVYSDSLVVAPAPAPIPETGDGMGIFVFAGLALISMLGMVAMKKREEF